MPAVNFSAARQFHLAAERWERCRAAWFDRQGKGSMAMRCKCLANDHLRAARDAAIKMQQPQKSPWI